MAFGLNKWEVYELLKGNERFDCKQLYETNLEEIIEGIVEYIYSNRGVVNK